MVTFSQRTIEPSARLHCQEAAMKTAETKEEGGGGGCQETAACASSSSSFSSAVSAGSDLALHVGGWYQRQEQAQILPGKTMVSSSSEEMEDAGALFTTRSNPTAPTTTATCIKAFSNSSTDINQLNNGHTNNCANGVSDNIITNYHNNYNSNNININKYTARGALAHESLSIVTPTSATTSACNVPCYYTAAPSVFMPVAPAAVDAGRKRMRDNALECGAVTMFSPPPNSLPSGISFGSYVNNRLEAMPVNNDCAYNASLRAAKRVCSDNGSATSTGSSCNSGVRITDLLNPAAISTPAAAPPPPPLSQPSVLSRSQSVDAKHYYQVIQMQLQLQQQKVAGSKAPGAVDPRKTLARALTVPESSDNKRAQGIFREALELDKLYDIACIIIESIWPNHSVSQRTQLCSLRCFVAETHRQSRLSIDVLELSMFYLLRAKSIIQAKQRAAREQEKQEQAAAAAQSMYQNQLREYNAAAMNMADASTPPLSPSSPLSVNGCGAAIISKSATRNRRSSSVVGPQGIISVSTEMERQADKMLSPPSTSPITPNSAQQLTQIAYVTMEKNLLDNDLVTPISPIKAQQQQQQQKSKPQAVKLTQQQQQQQRVLAGKPTSLPNSFRQFCVAPGAATETPVSAIAAASAAAVARSATATATATAPTATSPAKAKKPDVTKCGRRMFVAALISASKFMQDRTYSNKAWNKITKLPLPQIGEMERAFLAMIDYRLYVDQRTYEKFHRLLARSGMRNGRLMVCEQPQKQPSGSSPSPSDSLAAGTSPLSSSSPVAQSSAVDLRSMMGAPIPVSGSATPDAKKTQTAFMQEHILNLLRIKQQQQQNVYRQHMDGERRQQAPTLGW